MSVPGGEAGRSSVASSAGEATNQSSTSGATGDPGLRGNAQATAGSATNAASRRGGDVKAAKESSNSSRPRLSSFHLFTPQLSKLVG